MSTTPEITSAVAGPTFQRLGEILIERGKIEAEDLARALELQLERGDKLGKILVDMGLIAQRDVLAALSEQLGVPLVTIDGPPPSAPEIDGLSHRFLRQCRAFPTTLIQIPDNQLVVVAVRLAYLNWEDTSGLPGQILMRADRRSALAGDIKEEQQ